MRRLIDFHIHEHTVFAVIITNAIALFLDAFPAVHLMTNGLFWWIDYCCVIFFFVEAIIKLQRERKAYFMNRWNRFDFAVVVLSLPSLLAPVINLHAFAAVLVLRLARLFRFFRLFRFIPNGPKIWVGVTRALKASVGIFIVLFILNLVFAIGATILFGKYAPEYFGNPLESGYSLFRIFTLEGWYEIPDILAHRCESESLVYLSRIFFVVAVLVGGILGLSLANAIFVDQMTADNTALLEDKVDHVMQELQHIRRIISGDDEERISETLRS